MVKGNKRQNFFKKYPHRYKKCSKSIIIDSPLFSFFVYYYILMILSKEINTFEYVSEINITINGNGNQQILSSKTVGGYGSGVFNSFPNLTLVNGIPQSGIEKYVYNLVNQTNIITMRWNYQLKSCRGMFSYLTNIISIDLSNFDSSQVESFECMFDSCTSLISINLTNMNTSSAKNMVGMFESCPKLETLNLSSFDTSRATSMWAICFIIVQH